MKPETGNTTTTGARGIILRIRDAIQDRHRWLREADKFERGSPERAAARGRAPSHAETEALQQDAKAAFAKLNGWTPSPHEIGPQDIGKAGRRRLDGDGEEILPARPKDIGRRFFDHQHGYRRNGRYVALVCEPYEEVNDADDLKRVRDWLNKRGLDLFMPPDPLASFHYTRRRPARMKPSAPSNNNTKWESE